MLESCRLTWHLGTQKSKHDYVVTSVGQMLNVNLKKKNKTFDNDEPLNSFLPEIICHISQCMLENYQIVIKLTIYIHIGVIGRNVFVGFLSIL